MSEASARRAPAMTDVARLAGVSHQTVSRVLNDHPSVRPQTRIRVQAAMDQLGYRPNLAARALVTGRFETIGIVAQSSTLFGPTSMLAALERVAAAADFQVAIASARSLDPAGIREAVERHSMQQVAGIILIVPVESAAPALDALPAGVPVVTIDGDPSRAEPAVMVDQVLGARLATEYLLDAGHPTVWHVSGPADWFDSQGRISGWRAALQDRGVDVPPVVPADWSPERGYEAGLMLARMPDVTAIFAANDHLALGLIKALRERDRAVPGDVSIVGFDDIPGAAFFSPPLTTVRPDFDTVAESSLRLLRELLDGGVPEHAVRVAPSLVVRESVASYVGSPAGSGSGHADPEARH